MANFIHAWTPYVLGFMIFLAVVSIAVNLVEYYFNKWEDEE